MIYEEWNGEEEEDNIVVVCIPRAGETRADEILHGHEKRKTQETKSDQIPIFIFRLVHSD